jgi:HSP20 family protein
MALTRWDPFYSFPSVDRIFDEFFRARRPALNDGVAGVLPIDVYENKDELVVKALLPGAEPKDVTVHVERGTLTIQAHIGGEAEQEADKDQRWHTREVWRGDVSRTVTLPAVVDADKATANFKNGVLTLQVPKAETAKPRQIPVHAGD